MGIYFDPRLKHLLSNAQKIKAKSFIENCDSSVSVENPAKLAKTLSISKAESILEAKIAQCESVEFKSNKII